MEIDKKYYHTSKFNLIIKESQLYNGGLGVYTNEYIEKNTIIDEYYGEKLTTAIGGSYVLMIHNKCFIDASNEPRCYMAMLNDASYRPKINYKKKSGRKLAKIFIDYNYTNNCEFVLDEINEKAYIKTIININIGEELFVSYGKDYWL